jgi:hypothetical protein
VLKTRFQSLRFRIQLVPLQRGFLLNFGVHHATTSAIGLPFSWSPPILFITCFVTIFAVVISITKDLADIEVGLYSCRLQLKSMAWKAPGFVSTLAPIK